MKKKINCEKSNNFTGSLYKDKYQSKDSVIRLFNRCKEIKWIGFQWEGGEDIADHWQFVFKTSGKQQRQSYYRRKFGWYKDQESPNWGWISACNCEKASLAYCKKSDSKKGEFIEWNKGDGYMYKRFKFDVGLSERNLTLGLLSNKMNEIAQWSDWMRIWKEENPGVVSCWGNTRDLIGGGCGLKNK